MPGKRWVQREKESLIRQVKQGKRLPQIRISGRSPAAVNQQRQGLRNAGPLGEVPKRRLRLWTTKEIRSLRGYVNRFRLSAAQIARAGLLAGRGKDSISQQMRRQGLGDPKRQEASRSAHRLDAKEKAALERFLTESRIIYCQSRQREDCFQKAVIKRGLRRIRRSALRARSSSSQ